MSPSSNQVILGAPRPNLTNIEESPSLVSVSHRNSVDKLKENPTSLSSWNALGQGPYFPPPPQQPSSLSPALWSDYSGSKPRSHQLTPRLLTTTWVRCPISPNFHCRGLGLHPISHHIVSGEPSKKMVNQFCITIIEVVNLAITKIDHQ